MQVSVLLVLLCWKVKPLVIFLWSLSTVLNPCPCSILHLINRPRFQLFSAFGIDLTSCTGFQFYIEPSALTYRGFLPHSCCVVSIIDSSHLYTLTWAQIQQSYHFLPRRTQISGCTQAFRWRRVSLKISKSKQNTYFLKHKLCPI